MTKFKGNCKNLNGEYMFDTYIVDWYYVNRGATDRRLALKIVGYKNDRQSFQARAVIFVLFYCFLNLLRIQEQRM